MDIVVRIVFLIYYMRSIYMKKLLACILAVSMICSGIGVSADTTDNTENNIIEFSGILEKLDRGLVVQMYPDGGTYLTWRLMENEDAIFGTAEGNVEFNIYKNGSLLATEKYTTNYIDTDGTSEDKYQVAPVTSGTEGEISEEAAAFSSGSNYFDIPLDIPEDSVVQGETWAYMPGDTTFADLDGDGDFELIVLWDARTADNGFERYTSNAIIDAYEMEPHTNEDGTHRLWRIDMGVNIRSGKHYTQLVAGDYNGDGKAEMILRTAPGSTDSQGNYVTDASSIEAIKNADNSVYLVNSIGKILEGDEYLTVYNGMTGEAIDTIYYPISRDPEGMSGGASFGDLHGNRCDRFLAANAKLDGVHRYYVGWRGYYKGATGPGRTGVFAIRLDENEKFVTDELYIFDTNSNEEGYTEGNEIYIGQGSHCITAGDVDNDGKDEIFSAVLCMELDETNKLNPKWCGYRGHGDAIRLGEIDPTNDGLEYFTVHESGKQYGTDGVTYMDYGMTLYNAEDGREIKHYLGVNDTEVALIGDFGMGGLYQFWAMDGYIGYGNGEFEQNKFDGASYYYVEGDHHGAENRFKIYWDGDLYDEAISRLTSLDPMSIIDYNGYKLEKIFELTDCGGDGDVTYNPNLQADLFGD